MSRPTSLATKPRPRCCSSTSCPATCRASSCAAPCAEGVSDVSAHHVRSAHHISPCCIWCAECIECAETEREREPPETRPAMGRGARGLRRSLGLGPRAGAAEPPDERPARLCECVHAVVASDPVATTSDPVRRERPRRRIPEATVARLPVYLRILYDLAERRIAT